MAELDKGQVIVTKHQAGNTTFKLRYTSRKGKEMTVSPAHAQLAPDLARAIPGTLEVDFELVQGQPTRIRRTGEGWPEPRSPERTPPPTRSTAQPRPSTPVPTTSPAPSAKRSPSQRKTAPGARHFHNPYNFVPTPPRDVAHTTLGDIADRTAPNGALPRHDLLQTDRWTGRLTILMETVTPLLVHDASQTREDDHHKTHSPRIDSNGRPLIPPTSVKGALRSAYEAITHSRFGVFVAHEDRLGRRMAAREGLRLVPARVEGTGATAKLVLLTGATSGFPTRSDRGWSVPGAMYAAWLPRYRPNLPGPLQNRVRLNEGTDPTHGQEVHCWLEEIRHTRRGFTYWRVRAMATSPDALGPAPSPSNASRDHTPTKARMKQASGWVCITNQNIRNKHDERVFFAETDAHRHAHPLEPALRDQWRELITNYQEIHAEELNKRFRNGEGYDAYLGGEPGKTAWSRHVYDDGAYQLQHGTLCYASVEHHQGKLERINALYPVMIARELHEQSPANLLDPSLHPARELRELSAADRVFGWVSQDKGSGAPQRAYRGHVRIGPVTCTSLNAIKWFQRHLPLAILSTPKPQQARFYVAGDMNGNAPDDTDRDADRYRPGVALRGRKVYPHQDHLPTGHWTDSPTFRPAESVHPEYARPRSTTDDQNSSITGWVVPGARFAFDLHVTNLSEVELGALLWLLTLPDNACHRLGGGKPLGFGSVRMHIETAEIAKGDAWRTAWRDLDPSPQWELTEVTTACEPIQAFQQAVNDTAGANASNFDRVPYIAAFLKSACGYGDGKPVHYPRARQRDHATDAAAIEPHHEGRAYEWFVANVRAHPPVALPNLADDPSPGLPLLDSTPPGRQDGRDNRGGRGGRGRW